MGEAVFGGAWRFEGDWYCRQNCHVCLSCAVNHFEVERGSPHAFLISEFDIIQMLMNPSLQCSQNRRYPIISIETELVVQVESIPTARSKVLCVAGYDFVYVLNGKGDVAGFR